MNKFSLRVYNKVVRKVPKNKVCVIPLPYSGQSHKNFPLRKFNLAQGLNIGVIARWDRIKNHQALLALAKEINRQNLNWQIFSVTKIPDTKKFLGFKNQYRQYIRVIPPMGYKKLIKFYQKMDIMVLPSHFDVSPNVVMEAAQEGLITLISPNVGWADEYMENGRPDLIVDFSRPGLVVKKIKKIASEKVPNKFLESLLRKHEKNKIFKEYLRLFGGLIVIKD